MRKFITLITALLLALNSHADDKTYLLHDGNEIHYSAFNSSFISPEIASQYGITRGKNRGLINIAVVPAGQVGGKSALVKGFVSNLLGQTKKLDFFAVRERDVVYYLAPFKFDNKDPLTFKINVTPDPNKPPYNFSFQKTLYHD